MAICKFCGFADSPDNRPFLSVFAPNGDNLGMRGQVKGLQAFRPSVTAYEKTVLPILNG